MKKFMKICGISAAIMVFLGILMVALTVIVKGPQMIGNVKNYVERNVEALEQGVSIEMDTFVDFETGEEVLEGSSNQQFSREEITGLKVEMGGGELNILPSEDEYFYMDVNGMEKSQGYVSNGTLMIKSQINAKIEASLNSNHQGIELSVPKSGEINLYVPTDFQFNKVEIALGAGEISCESPLLTEMLEIELGAGEIRLDALQAGTVKAEVGAGTLSLAGEVLREIDAACAMGTMEIELKGAEEDFNYDLEVAAGSVEIGNGTYTGVVGEKSIDNKASKDIDVECAMGTVEISFVQ